MISFISLLPNRQWPYGAHINDGHSGMDLQSISDCAGNTKYWDSRSDGITRETPKAFFRIVYVSNVRIDDEFYKFLLTLNLSNRLNCTDPDVKFLQVIEYNIWLHWCRFHLSSNVIQSHWRIIFSKLS